MDLIQEYWNKKFKDKQKIWGDEPSESAIRAVKYLKKNSVAQGKILDLACGYGRDSIFFSENTYAVRGIDISDEAISLAGNNYKNIDFIVGDIFNLPYRDQSFDVVFGNFILHLFLGEDRSKILNEALRVTKNGGISIFSVASVEDADYGVGKEVGKDCYVNSRGVTKFYYSKESIMREFSNFSDIEIDVIEEYHDHDTPHKHSSYLIFAKRMS